MRKFEYYSIIIAIIIVSGCTISSSYHNYTREELEQELSSAQKELHQIINKEYIAYSDERLITMPFFGGFDFYFIVNGDNDVIVPEDIGPCDALNATRELPNFHYRKLTKLLMQDAEYKSIKESGSMSKSAHRKIHIRLMETSMEYRKLHNEYMKILRLANKESLIIIIDDYNAKDELIPIDWIPEDDMSVLLGRSSIKKAKIRVSEIEQALATKHEK